MLTDSHCKGKEGIQGVGRLGGMKEGQDDKW